ncbi:MAG: M20 family metallopeptidase [Chloroflexota bacterium]
MTDLKTYFDEQRQDMLDLLTDLVEIESPSKDKVAVDNMSAKMAALFEAQGASVERVAREEVGDIIIGTWNANAGGKPIVILSHVDTVWDIGTVAERPVRLEDDGRMYGPGIVDMKGGIVIALYAIKGLLDRDELPDRPIIYVATTDEEIGSRHSKALIEETADGAALVLVTEPPTGDGSLKTWRKGVANYKLNITGKASHAGNEPEMGVNAIVEFAQHTMELTKLNDYKNGTSVSVTTVQGGTATNVIPANLEARIDVRAMTDNVYQRVHEKIMERLPFIPGAQVNIERLHYRPPMERDGATFEQAKKIASNEGITIREDGAGGGSDGNFTAAMGIPTLDGMGAEGGGLHALHEHVLVNSLPKKAALMAAILRDWE